MEERLQLSLERIKEIPEEVSEIVAYAAYFSSLSNFFLQYLTLSEKNREEIPSLIEEVFARCRIYRYPREALFKDKYGDILSILLYYSLGIVYEEKEVSRCRILELFIELYLVFLQSSSPERKLLKDIIFNHFYDYAGDFLEEWYEEEGFNKSNPEKSFFIRHNLLFPLFFPFCHHSPYFLIEYEASHFHDCALILGNSLISHLKSFPYGKKMRGFIPLAPSGLSFHEYQEKLLRKIESDYSFDEAKEEN